MERQGELVRRMRIRENGFGEATVESRRETTRFRSQRSIRNTIATAFYTSVYQFPLHTTKPPLRRSHHLQSSVESSTLRPSVNSNRIPSDISLSQHHRQRTVPPLSLPESFPHPPSLPHVPFSRIPPDQFPRVDIRPVEICSTVNGVRTTGGERKERQ